MRLTLKDRTLSPYVELRAYLVTGLTINILSKHGALEALEEAGCTTTPASSRRLAVVVAPPLWMAMRSNSI